MNRYFLEIGSIRIYWYSVLILSAVLVGMYLAIKETKKLKINSNYMSDLVYYLVIVSILGARFYYVVFNFDLYKGDLISIFYIWEGGMAIYGSIIASLIFIYFYSKKRGVKMLLTTDILVPVLILGQAIGRWGNFFNQEAYGPVVDITFLKRLCLPDFIIKGMYIDGSYYHPTFLYESIWCIIGFVLLLVIRKFYKCLKMGQLTYIYFIWYGLGRFFIESLRQDSLYFLGIKISQLVSIGLVIIGMIGIIYSRKNLQYSKGNKK